MKRRRQSFWLPGSLALFCLVTTSPLRAQIIQDATLPNPSTVNQNENTSVITGGTQAGPNLFHSFKEFSVPTGESASFQQIEQGIENIISRVTGFNVSNIDGLIEVLEANGTVSPANFFLINPNGIIFGPNAQLNIGGSFLASTASSLNFADGTQFSTTTPQTTPLLSVSVPLGLQFGGTTQSILNQSQATDSDGYLVGLQVQPGKTLALVGGDVALAGGALTAAGGRIELGSVAGNALVNLTSTDFDWTLGYEGVQNFQDIRLSQQAVVDASGEGGGDIQLSGRRVSVRDGSEIGTYTLGSESGGALTVTASESVELIGRLADDQIFGGLLVGTDGSGDAPDLMIATRQLVVRDGAQVFSGTDSKGQGGNLTVTASDSVKVIGTSADGWFPSSLFTQTGGAGAAGKLTIETSQLVVRDGARVLATTSDEGQGGNLAVTASDFVELTGTSADGNISSGLFTSTESAGASGNLTIETRRLLVRDGSQVLTSTSGQGQAGNLTVQNATVVELVGGIIANGKFFPSGLLTQASAEATGAGGKLSISTGKLTVRDGAQVNSTTFGAGRAGDLTVRATEVELFGAALSADGKLLTNDEFGLPYGSGLFAGTNEYSRGDGGKLTVETDRLSLRDGAVVQTATFGEGDAGNLTIQATDEVELVGTFADDRFPTSLGAFSGGIPGLRGVIEAKGRAGDLTIETGELIVRDRAAVTVSSLNPTSDALGAGNLQITAQTIRLNNLGELTAATASGNGGNITLLVQDLLLLRRNSNISTTAGATGNGGNITIANTPFIVAVPSENSDIKANAFLGQGGKVTIDAQSVFGLTVRNLKDLQTLLQAKEPTKLDPINLLSSDITAISQTNLLLSGEVTINTPDVDPSRGLAILPAELVDATGLIAQACPAGGGQGQSEFTVTGRGGLPENPSDSLSSDAVEVDLVTLNPKVENRSSPNVSTLATSVASAPIVEAQGWVIGANGEVLLTATAPTVTPHSPGLPTQCHTLKSAH